MSNQNTDLSLTGSITRYEFPYLLSSLYRKYRSAESQSARYAFALLLGEGVFRFLAIVNMSNAIAEGAPAANVKKWMKLINSPSMGRLLGLNRSTINFIVSQDKQPFLAEISAFFQDDAWDDIQTIFPEKRNDYAHRYMFLSEDAAIEQLRVLQPVLDQLLLGIQFLRNYHFGTFVDVSRRPKDGYYTADWRASRGSEEDHESVEMRFEAQPIEGVPLIVDSTFRTSLSLFPLIQRTKTEGIPQYVWFEQIEGAQDPKYIHPILLTTTPQIPLKDLNGALNAWRNYTKEANNWHILEEINAEASSVESLKPSFPKEFGEQFEYVGLLGKGGMGEVYEVKNSLGLTRALKVLNPQYARDKSQWKRMQRAAETLAKLNHPSIAQVYAISETSEGLPFIEMELIEGSSLSEALKVHKQFALRFALEIMRQLLDVLVYVHSVDVWHRDIKPSNIMWDGDNNQLYLIDFGIAKDNQKENLTATHTSSRMGSEYWMAPEQFHGKASAQSDIYAAGLVMSALLGSSPLLPTRAPNFPEHAPDKLKEIYTKATAENPKERYQSTSDMLEDVRNVLVSLTPTVQESTNSTSSVPNAPSEVTPSNKTGVLKWMVLTVGMLIVLGLVFAGSGSLKGKPTLEANLTVQIFPANTDRAISDDIAKQLKIALTDSFAQEKNRLKVTLGTNDWSGRADYSKTKFLYNPQKNPDSSDFVRQLEAFCAGSQIVASTQEAGFKLSGNHFYIFLGDDYQSIIDCFE